MTTHEERTADDWWETLSAERRVQVHRWVSQHGGGPPPVDPLQATIDDALTEADA